MKALYLAAVYLMALTFSADAQTANKKPSKKTSKTTVQNENKVQTFYVELKPIEDKASFGKEYSWLEAADEGSSYEKYAITQMSNKKFLFVLEEGGCGSLGCGFKVFVSDTAHIAYKKAMDIIFNNETSVAYLSKTKGQFFIYFNGNSANESATWKLIKGEFIKQ